MAKKTAKKHARDKVAEKLGYRWMMRCLRAIETRGSALPREARVFVKHVSRKHFGGPHGEFKRLYAPAAAEAVALLNTDAALHAECLFRAPVDGLPKSAQNAHFYPHSHLIEIFICW